VTRAPLSPSPRSTVRRLGERARTDRAELYAVLDEALICHLGVVVDGGPRVLPTGYGRIDDTLYLHGSTGASSLRAAESTPVCVTVTLLDGIVYARSVFHHSMNYRSAVVHGRPRVVADAGERVRALEAIVDHLAPGSWAHARRPTRKELAATTVLALDLAEASVKVRTGPPKDDEDDVLQGGRWAGVLPVRSEFGAPEPCELLDSADVPAPGHVAGRRTS
jgi:nitroimidazol reductase NimA-like FMN-containing flavoprotein (pyridoxamine 5'-phosphate oxidase superfamily)